MKNPVAITAVAVGFFGLAIVLVLRSVYLGQTGALWESTEAMGGAAGCLAYGNQMLQRIAP